MNVKNLVATMPKFAIFLLVYMTFIIKASLWLIKGYRTDITKTIYISGVLLRINTILLIVGIIIYMVENV